MAWIDPIALDRALRTAAEGLGGCDLQACVDLESGMMIVTPPPDALDPNIADTLAVVAANAFLSPEMADATEDFRALSGDDGPDDAEGPFRRLLLLTATEAHLFVRLPGRDNLAAYFHCPAPDDPGAFLTAASNAVEAHLAGQEIRG